MLYGWFDCQPNLFGVTRFGSGECEKVLGIFKCLADGLTTLANQGNLTAFKGLPEGEFTSFP